MSPTRISAENASGCVRSTIARVRINRSEILRSRNVLNHAENLPTSKKSFADRNAIHQKTSENAIIGTPTSTAKACGDVAVPLMTGMARSTTGRPQVEKDGTTAVAMMDDAIEICAIPHRVNI